MQCLMEELFSKQSKILMDLQGQARINSAVCDLHLISPYGRY